MKLSWKLFCSMVSVTILACAAGGFLLIDGQFRTALEQEVDALYEENDMLRYALSMAAEGRALSSREELAQLAQGMDWVFVNGVPAIAEGRFTGNAGGRCLS